MNVLEYERPAPSAIPGVDHVTLASRANGLTQLSLWRQRMAPGACTPPHSHDCDEVVMCLSGWGELHTEGGVERFGKDCTLVLPAGRQHQFFNIGQEPLETVGIFAATPVVTRDTGGQALPLPWQS